MYIPPAFKQDDLGRLHRIIRDYSFALLITVRDGAPFASHIPFLLDEDRGPNGTLVAHIARPNPQWRGFGEGEALALFQGPHGYISPGWYESRGANVPTWNYAAVHAYGRVRIIDDPAAVDRILARLTAIHEAGATQWSVGELDRGKHEALRRGLVAFEMPIDRIEGKFKLSQNKTERDISGAVDGLRTRGDAESLALAELMAVSSSRDIPPA